MKLFGGARRRAVLAFFVAVACGDEPTAALPPPPPPPDPGERLAMLETFGFAEWLVAQDGDGVVLLLPADPLTAQSCPSLDRPTFGDRLAEEAGLTVSEDPLEEGGVKSSSEAIKEAAVLENPLADLEPKLEIKPAEEQIPFADLPGDSLYMRAEFGTHISFDFWDSRRRSALPLTDQLLALVIDQWQSLTRFTCMGMPIPEDSVSEEGEQERQHSLARARRMGLRFLVVDTEAFGEEGMAHLATQVESQLRGRQDFTDGTGVTIFELFSPDVRSPL